MQVLLIMLTVLMITLFILYIKSKIWHDEDLKIFSCIYYHNFMPNKREYLKQFNKNFKILTSFRCLNKILTINDSKLIEIIFKLNQDSIGRSFSIYPGSSIMKSILPHLDNDDWRRVKNFMVKGFKSKNLKIFQSISEITTIDHLNSVLFFVSNTF